MAFHSHLVPSTQRDSVQRRRRRRLIAAGEDGWQRRPALLVRLSGPATLTSPPPAATLVLTLTGTWSGTAVLTSAPPLAHGLPLEHSSFELDCERSFSSWFPGIIRDVQFRGCGGSDLREIVCLLRLIKGGANKDGQKICEQVIAR